MKATILDLRYNMKTVLNALERNETIDVTYHGKTKATMIPVQQKNSPSLSEHPFFGMAKEDTSTIRAQIDHLRGPRYDI